MEIKTVSPHNLYELGYHGWVGVRKSLVSEKKSAQTSCLVLRNWEKNGKMWSGWWIPISFILKWCSWLGLA